MGCTNGVLKQEKLEYKIMSIVKVIGKYEEKMKIMHQQFLQDLENIADSKFQQNEEQIIAQGENKTVCDTIGSQRECRVKNEQILIKNYQQQIYDLKTKVKYLIKQAQFYTDNCASLKKTQAYSMLIQYIQRFQQNPITFQKISVQHQKNKDNLATNLGNLGIYCESVIIQ